MCMPGLCGAYLHSVRCACPRWLRALAGLRLQLCSLPSFAITHTARRPALLTARSHRHRNVVELLGGCMSPPRPFLVFERMECSLAQALHERRRQLSLEEVLWVAVDTAQALVRRVCLLCTASHSPPHASLCILWACVCTTFGDLQCVCGCIPS